MAKEKRVIFQAGRLWYAKQYTPLRGAAPPGERRERQRYSTQVREAINFRTSYEKLWLLLECNFKWNDLYVTMGYYDERRPSTKEAAEKRLTCFIRSLREHRRMNGQELVYVRVTEGFHSGGILHHHLIVNAVGDDFNTIRKLWAKNGSNVEFKYYCFKAPIAHAQYLTKEPRLQGRRHVGDRTWRVSRNCRRPTIIRDDVTAGSIIKAPPGAKIQIEETTTNSFGRFQYVHAIMAADAPNSDLG